MYTPDLLKPHEEKYRGIVQQGMKVEAVLTDRLITTEPVTLDGLLAWAVVQEAQNEAGERIPFQEREDIAFLPLPLKRLWSDEAGGPLWCASFFIPDEVDSDVEYFHKRAPDGHRTKSKHPESFGVKGVTGRWAERRTPFPVTIARKLEAWCLGDVAEVRRLLQYVTHVGKKTAEGFGIVREWIVEPVDVGERDCLIRDGKLARNIPAGYGGIEIEAPSELLGWAPPYWNKAYYGPGFRFGMRI